LIDGLEQVARIDRDFLGPCLGWKESNELLLLKIDQGI